MKRLPTPGTLATVTSPPMAWASRRVSASPTPEPPSRVAIEVGLSASTTTYNKQLAGLADAKLKAGEQAEQLRERLTRQFAGMDARVAAYKSTQTFLDNQIKAWNRSDA